jgi:lysophospholipase L1-like esterase
MGNSKSQHSTTTRLKYACLALFALAVVLLVYLAITRVAATGPAAGATPGPAPTFGIDNTATVAAFIGDSYAQGVGASSDADRWTSLVSSSEGWRQENFGRGGTGYLATSGPEGCGLDFCPSFDGMIPEAVEAQPDVLVISGGQNDFNTFVTARSSVEDAITKTMSDARSALPDTRIIVVGPSSPNGVDADFTAFADTVRQSAAAIGAEYVDLASPDVIDPANVLPDGGHVNDAGHAAIADRVTAGI